MAASGANAEPVGAERRPVPNERRPAHAAMITVPGYVARRIDLTYGDTLGNWALSALAAWLAAS